MSFGVRAFDATGRVIWDSSAAAAGVVADVRVVAAGDALTTTYPDFAGRPCAALVLYGFGDTGVTVDTLLGYPRVVIPSYPDPRRVLVLMF